MQFKGLKVGTKVHQSYGSKKLVKERFRHRFECNPKYIDAFETNGMIFSGKHPEYDIMQAFELAKHKFFVGTQAHPEFTSKPLQPNPLYIDFVEACLKK